MKRFLKVGEVFELKKGMTVYMTVPECFIYSNKRSSPMNQTTETSVKIGQVLSNTMGKTFNTSDIAGEYIVIDTSLQGGGIGHGFHDVYPDGHNVVAKKLKKDGSYSKRGQTVSFYQSGSFTAMILPKEIEKVIKKMEMSFS